MLLIWNFKSLHIVTSSGKAKYMNLFPELLPGLKRFGAELLCSVLLTGCPGKTDGSFPSRCAAALSGQQASQHKIWGSLTFHLSSDALSSLERKIYLQVKNTMLLSPPPPIPPPLCLVQQGRLARHSIRAVERSALPGRMEFELIGTHFKNTKKPSLNQICLISQPVRLCFRRADGAPAGLLPLSGGLLELDLPAATGLKTSRHNNHPSLWGPSVWRIHSDPTPSNADRCIHGVGRNWWNRCETVWFSVCLRRKHVLAYLSWPDSCIWIDKVKLLRSLWHSFYNSSISNKNTNIFPSVKIMTATMLSQFLNLARWALKDIRRVCCWRGCKWKLVFCVCVARLQQQDFSTRSTAKRQKQPRCCEPLGAPRRAQAAAKQEGVAGTDDRGWPVSRQPTQLTWRDGAGVIAATGNLKHRVDSVYIWLEVQLWRGSDVFWPVSNAQCKEPFCPVFDQTKRT